MPASAVTQQPCWSSLQQTLYTSRLDLKVSDRLAASHQYFVADNMCIFLRSFPQLLRLADGRLWCPGDLLVVLEGQRDAIDAVSLVRGGGESLALENVSVCQLKIGWTQQFRRRPGPSSFPAWHSPKVRTTVVSCDSPKSSLPVSTGDLRPEHAHGPVLMPVHGARNSVEERGPAAARVTRCQLFETKSSLQTTSPP